MEANLLKHMLKKDIACSVSRCQLSQLACLRSRWWSNDLCSLDLRNQQPRTHYSSSSPCSLSTGYHQGAILVYTTSSEAAQWSNKLQSAGFKGEGLKDLYTTGIQIYLYIRLEASVGSSCLWSKKPNRWTIQPHGQRLRSSSHFDNSTTGNAG